MSKDIHQQVFYLELPDNLSIDSQFCYIRPDGFDVEFRTMTYDDTSDTCLVDFPTTMTLFTVKQIPLPVPTPVSMTFSGALVAGDTFRIVQNDLRPLYPSSVLRGYNTETEREVALSIHNKLKKKRERLSSSRCLFQTERVDRESGKRQQHVDLTFSVN